MGEWQEVASRFSPSIRDVCDGDWASYRPLLATLQHTNSNARIQARNSEARRRGHEVLRERDGRRDRKRPRLRAHQRAILRDARMVECEHQARSVFCTNQRTTIATRANPRCDLSPEVRSAMATERQLRR